MPLVRFDTHWAIKRIIWGTYIYFTKFIKSPDRRLIKEWMIGNSVKPFYLATAQELGKAISPIGIKEKGG